MNTILLSIIVPAYNMENYLERCLSSLLVDENLMQRFEVLVINDGSKDRTSEIAHAFEVRYPSTFRAIDKDNGHYGSCINRGLAEAKGTFVKVLDADDAFDKGILPSYLLFLQEKRVEEDVDVILSDSSIVDENGKEKRVHPFSKQDGVFTVEALTYSDKYYWYIHGLAYRTSLLRRIAYVQTEKIAYTDNEWALIPMAYADKLVHFDAALYHYTIGRENQSVNDVVHAKNLWMEAEVIEHLLTYFNREKDKIDTIRQAFLSDKLLIIITHLYQLYLFTYRHFRISLDPLKRLDEKLAFLDPSLYEKTEQYKTQIGGISFLPIKNWRHRHYVRMTLQSLLYRFADYLGQLKRKGRIPL